MCATLAVSTVASADESDANLESSTSYVTIYRLYNPYSGEHLYTESANEYNYLGKIGWKQEGVAWTSPSKSNTPVYRLYNRYSGDHHYTTSTKEYNYLGSIGWTKEGESSYSAEGGEVTVYRLFNPYETVGTHHYTTSKKEYDYLGKIGWKQEGIGWYGATNSFFDGAICNGDHATNVGPLKTEYVKVKKPFTQTVTRTMDNTECGCGKWYLDLSPLEQDEPDLFMRYKTSIAFHWPSGKQITDDEAKAWKIQDLKNSWSERYGYITTWEQVVDLKKDDEWISNAYQKQPLKNSYTERQLLDAQQVYSAKREMALYEHQLKAILEYRRAVNEAYMNGSLAFRDSILLDLRYDENDTDDVRAKKAQEALGIKIPVRNVDYCPAGNHGFWQYTKYTYKIYRETYATTCRSCGGVKTF